jgi:hypothetical protein
MDESSLVGDGTIAAHEDVICDRLAEDFNFEYVSDDLLGLPIDVGMYEGNVVVTCDDVPERR